MNVKIILSTAAANVSGEIPELETKYITSAMLHAKSNVGPNKRKKRAQVQVQRNRLSKASSLINLELFLFRILPGSKGMCNNNNPNQ